VEVENDSQGGEGGGCMVPRRSWKLAFVSGFWRLCPRPSPGLCPWTPMGTSVPQTPSIVPHSKFLATPLMIEEKKSAKMMDESEDVLPQENFPCPSIPIMVVLFVTAYMSPLHHMITMASGF